jgi:hypothetical protein
MKKCKCGVEFKQYNSLNVFCSSTCKFKFGKKINIKLKSLNPISKVSPKRKIENAKYTVLRIEFLSKPENRICPITGWPATEVHHTYCGKDRAKYYLDTTTWIAVSRDGHNWIHDNPKEAREKGFLK